MPNNHVIIDMGSSRISVMATEILETGEVRVLSEESKKSADIKYGVVEQPSNAAFTINELIRLLKNSARLNEVNEVGVSINAKTMRQVAVRISRSLGSSRVVTEALIEEMINECREKIRQQEVQVFEVIPVSYELDGENIDNPVDKRGNELVGVYHVIVGSIFIKEELNRCFDRTASIKLNSYTPLAVEALSTVLLDDTERQKGCAIINFGATTTTLAVYGSGTLQHLSVVPLGGKNITKDIQSLGISEQNAERLKCLKGSAMESFVKEPVKIKIQSIEEGAEPVLVETDFLATIIEARLTEIMAPVFKNIEEIAFPLHAGIVITGGASKLNNLVEFLQENIGLPVRYGDHSDWLANDTDERFYDPTFSQSIGTAVLLNEYALQHPEPVEDKKQNKNKSTNTKKKFTDKIADRFLKLFDDENYLK